MGHHRKPPASSRCPRSGACHRIFDGVGSDGWLGGILTQRKEWWMIFGTMFFVSCGDVVLRRELGSSQWIEGCVPVELGGQFQLLGDPCEHEDKPVCSVNAPALPVFQIINKWESFYYSKTYSLCTITINPRRVESFFFFCVGISGSFPFGGFCGFNLAFAALRRPRAASSLGSSRVKNSS